MTSTDAAAVVEQLVSERQELRAHDAREHALEANRLRLAAAIRAWNVRLLAEALSYRGGSFT